jgi:hypothetical protein
MRLLGMDTCPSLNDIMEIRCNKCTRSEQGDGDGCFLTCSWFAMFSDVLVSFNGDKKQREISILMHDNLFMVYPLFYSLFEFCWSSKLFTQYTAFPPFTKKAWPLRTPILPFIYVFYIITFYLFKQKSYIITNSQHHFRFYSGHTHSRK